MSWLESIRDVVETRSRHGDPVLFVPFLVTLYPLWSRRVPVYDLFCVHRAAAGAEDVMIASIERERVHLAVVWNVALDGLEERRFTAPTHWSGIPPDPFRAVRPGPTARRPALFRQDGLIHVDSFSII